MINEEYSFDDLKDFLLDTVDLLIVGWPNQEERSCFFYEKWYNTDTKILLVKREKNEKVYCKLLENKTTVFERNIDLCVGLSQLLNRLNINQKNVQYQERDALVHPFQNLQCTTILFSFV